MFDELGYAQFTKFSSGIPNTADKSSKLQKAVVNLVKNIDFLSDWTPFPENDTNTARREVNLSYRCLNMPSVRLVNGTVPEAKWTQTCSVSKDGNYTFSAYVRTDGIENGGAFLRISDGANVKTSRMVSASTATISGGPGADGWDRVFATINVPANAALTLEMCCTGTTGDALFSCPQLEEGSVPNRVNLLVHGDFGMVYLKESDPDYYFPDYWEKKSGILSAKGSHVIMDRAESNLPAELSGNALSLYSRPNRDSVAFGQIIYNRGAKGDCFTVGGWCNARSVAKIPESSIKNAPCIAYRFYDSDTNPGSWKYLNFSREWVGWQFGCWAITAPAAYTRLEILVNYARNAQKCMFSNIFVHREQFGKTFAYDDKKNVTSVANLAETKSNMEYDAYDNLTSYTQPGGSDSEKYTMTYGSGKTEKQRHLVRTMTTPEGIKQKFEYDGFGNQTFVQTEGTKDGVTKTINSKSEYTQDGNYLLNTYDARGKMVHRETDTDGTLKSVTDPGNLTVNYTYDASKRTEQVSASSEGKTYVNRYDYDKDLLSTIKHNTISNAVQEIVNNVPVDLPGTVKYTFGYDELGRKTTVKVGEQTLSTNVYTNNRLGLLKEVRFGTEEGVSPREGVTRNGGKVVYVYDDFGRMIGVKHDNEEVPRYTWEYGANGETALMRDTHLNRVHQTEYDLAERPCQSTIRDADGDILYRATITYDKKNRLASFGESVSNDGFKTTYAYDKDDRTTCIQHDGDHKVKYEYDELNRVHKRSVTKCVTADEETTDVDIITDEYAFEAGDTELYDENATTPLVNEIIQKYGNNEVRYAYTYDDCSDITSETRNNVTVRYKYDKLGQLIRVDDPNDPTGDPSGTTWVYAYDCGGNILSKTSYKLTAENATPTENPVEVQYTYGDENWKDKLTKYGNTTLSYDDIGNITADGAWNYEWCAGRQLKKMSEPIEGGRKIHFSYNHEGLRTQKKVEYADKTVTTDYLLHGKLVAHQTVTETDLSGNVLSVNEMHFVYDNDPRPAMVKFNGTMYFYRHNLQGDIVGIVDENGSPVVEYKYNAWGKLLAATGTLKDTLGELNPFRYRGYVYEEEAKLYYLRNRYYNPELQRFINTDFDIAGQYDPLSHNIYSYCLNDPINRDDGDGTWSLPNWAKVAIGTALIVGAVALTTVASGGLLCFAYGAAAGAAKGAISGAVGGAISGVVENRIQTGSWDGSLQAAVDGAADGYLSGAVGGFIMGGITSNACFIAGTLVHAECGLVPIEEIKADQMVWAEDPETGERALKRVVRTFLNEKDELVHVQVNGETITCTTEHPFYVQGKGWVAAKDLQLNDKLELQNGEDSFVDALRCEKLDEPIQVFNFEVEDFHTYYVGAGCVLVHNMCAQNTSKYGHYEIDYSDGTKYIGKGSEARMNVSASQHTFDSSGKTVRTVVNKQWYPSASNDMAFVDEYKLMKDCGFGKPGHNLLNKIQSPGLKKAIKMGFIV